MYGHKPILNKPVFCSTEKKSVVYFPSTLYRSFATTGSQLKICDFSEEAFKSFEVLCFCVSATTTQMLSSDEFCKLPYDTIPIQSASVNDSFYTSNSKLPNFEL
jgi:hypothetical protein